MYSTWSTYRLANTHVAPPYCRQHNTTVANYPSASCCSTATHGTHSANVDLSQNTGIFGRGHSGGGILTTAVVSPTPPHASPQSFSVFHPDILVFLLVRYPAYMPRSFGKSRSLLQTTVSLNWTGRKAHDPFNTTAHCRSQRLNEKVPDEGQQRQQRYRTGKNTQTTHPQGWNFQPNFFENKEGGISTHNEKGGSWNYLYISYTYIRYMS